MGADLPGRDAADLFLKLVDFQLDVASVLAGEGVVGRLYGQLAHALQDGVRLVERAFSGLNHGDAILTVPHGLVEAPHLGAHFLADGKPCGVVGG